jgi:toxin CcdB
MARELYRLSGVSGYVMNVQADLMSMLATVVVVPLLPVEDVATLMARLNPVFEIDGKRYAMATQAIGAVPRGELGASVGKIEGDKHYVITQALDMLLTGF